MKKFAIVLILASSGCDQFSPDGRLMAAAKEKVAAELKDPASAEFKDLQVIGATCVEGKVNSKNSFGGYVGFKEFKYDSKRNKTMIDPGMDEEINLDNFNDREAGLRQEFLGMTLKCLARST